MQISYIIKGNQNFYIECLPKTCNYKVYLNDSVFRFSKKDLPKIYTHIGGKAHAIELPCAKDVLVREYRLPDGMLLRARYSKFYFNDTLLPFEVETTVKANGNNNSVTFELEVLGDSDGLISKVIFPQPIVFDCEDPHAYSVLPMMQGALIPSKWKNPILTQNDGKYFDRDAYMPWWGQVFRDTAYQCICHTPYDAGYELHHAPSGNTSLASAWYPSLRQMHGRRSATYHFFEKATYNDFCANYRKHIEAQGEYVTLEQKIRRNPKLKERIGIPLVHDFLYTLIEPESPMYHKHIPEMNEIFSTFAERQNQLEELRSRGIDRFIVHFDGCGDKGYDNGHPDIFPINEKIGGAEGMRKFSEFCKKNSIPFDVHDQYRDLYLNAKSFNHALAIYDAQQNYPLLSLWQGGRQSILCARLMNEFLEHNLNEFQCEKIEFDGLHLGSLSGASLDECYNPLHPMSRKDCADYRRKAFALARSKGLIVTSDEPIDCFINSLDSVSHAPYSLTPNLWNGIGNGIPVPLFNLVYHDSLLVYWNDYSSFFGKWGIPRNDNALSHAILNANPLILDINADRDNIAITKKVCAQSAELAFERMVRHEFTDDSFRRQRTTFSDGTVIEVDFDKPATQPDAWSISKA